MASNIHIYHCSKGPVTIVTTIVAKEGAIQNVVGVTNINAIIKLGASVRTFHHFEIAGSLINIIAVSFRMMIISYLAHFVHRSLGSEWLPVNSFAVKVNVDITQGGII